MRQGGEEYDPIGVNGLHDAVGPKAIGAALNHMEEEVMGQRINQVRYYRFRDLKTALRKIVDDPASRKEVDELLP